MLRSRGRLLRSEIDRCRCPILQRHMRSLLVILGDVPPRFCCIGVCRYNNQCGEVKGLVMRCIRCESERTRKDGQTRLGGQRWRCNDCHRRFTARSTSAFSHHGFPDDVIALAVRWYVRYRLSYADVVEWCAERGLVVNRSTVYRWVQRFLPLFGEAARTHRRPVGTKWRVDETYTRLNGKWTYIYRAIDQDGQVVDAYFSKRRKPSSNMPSTRPA